MEFKLGLLTAGPVPSGVDCVANFDIFRVQWTGPAYVMPCGFNTFKWTWSALMENY